jgi:hypothetical protein
MVLRRRRLRLRLQFFRDLEQLLRYYLSLLFAAIEELKNQHPGSSGRMSISNRLREDRAI